MGASQQNYSGSCAPSIHPVSGNISHMHMHCLGSYLFWLTKENTTTTESANLFTDHMRVKKA